MPTCLLHSPRETRRNPLPTHPPPNMLSPPHMGALASLAPATQPPPQSLQRSTGSPKAALAVTSSPLGPLSPALFLKGQNAYSCHSDACQRVVMEGPPSECGQEGGGRQRDTVGRLPWPSLQLDLGPGPSARGRRALCSGLLLFALQGSQPLPPPASPQLPPPATGSWAQLEIGGGREETE